MVKTPVLFETYIRVEYARQVWNAIKKAQPRKLYFYSNKARVDYPDEIKQNNEIRSWIKEIDWECELHIWFRKDCVDIYTSLRGAISWLFDNEEAGIVLEDDCVPTKAFFSFVDQLIVKYRDDMRVWCISGNNFVSQKTSSYDYFFSHYHAMYGWASWRDRWKKIDWNNLRINETLDNHLYFQLFKTKEQALEKEKRLRKNRDHLEKTKCWDYVFGLIMDQQSGLTIQPKEHLVRNIGVLGHHHKSIQISQYNIESNTSSESYLIVEEPPFVIADFDYDYLTYSKLLKKNRNIRKFCKIMDFFRKKLCTQI